MAYDFDHYPPSPTLTNPDMILPDASSPTRLNRLSATTSLIIADLAQYKAIPISPPPISVRTSSPLSAIDEAEVTPTRTQKDPDNALASSPTLLRHPEEWPLTTTRRLSGNSNTSSSVHSEDLEKWKPTHPANDADESIVVEDEDKYGQDAKNSEDDEQAEGDPWPASREDDNGEDFLSRRAEIILANAKRRLNVSRDLPILRMLLINPIQAHGRKPQRRATFSFQHWPFESLFLHLPIYSTSIPIRKSAIHPCPLSRSERSLGPLPCALSTHSSPHIPQHTAKTSF
jgi:hypothetical protein